MKKSTRIVGIALAGMMVASTAAVGSVSVSAAKKVKKPKSVKAVNTAKGIKITWKKVKGAKKYQVFRGKKKITTTKKKTYTDKKVKAGKSYKYTVKAVKGKNKSKKSKAAKVVRLTKPALKSVSNSASGAVVNWKKVKGAKKYYVYSGKKKVGTTTKTTFTYTKAVSGKVASYKVKAANGKSASVASAAKKGMFLAAPDVTYVQNGNKVTLNWNKVDGATDYYVTGAVLGDSNYHGVASVKETTCTVELGANPTIWGFKVTANYVSGKTQYVSAEGKAEFAYFPDGCYFTDENGNLHVKLALKKGEAYKAGQFAAWDLDENSKYAVSVDEESAKVISVKDNIITAVGAGTGTVKVELDESAQKTLYNDCCAVAKKTFGNTLSTGVVYVDVTVTE